MLPQGLVLAQPLLAAAMAPRRPCAPVGPIACAKVEPEHAVPERAEAVRQPPEERRGGALKEEEIAVGQTERPRNLQSAITSTRRATQGDGRAP